MAKQKLEGHAAMRAKLIRLRTKFPNEAALALRQEAEIEATEVKRRTPVDKGTLRGTVHVVGPVREGLLGGTLYVMIVAGGPAAPYAVFVHEDLDAYHEVGQAKFLESVILESRAFMLQRVARRIDLNRALA